MTKINIHDISLKPKWPLGVALLAFTTIVPLNLILFLLTRFTQVKGGSESMGTGIFMGLLVGVLCLVGMFAASFVISYRLIVKNMWLSAGVVALTLAILSTVSNFTGMFMPTELTSPHQYAQVIAITICAIVALWAILAGLLYCLRLALQMGMTVVLLLTTVIILGVFIGWNTSKSQSNAYENKQAMVELQDKRATKLAAESYDVVMPKTIASGFYLKQKMYNDQLKRSNLEYFYSRTTDSLDEYTLAVGLTPSYFQPPNDCGGGNVLLYAEKSTSKATPCISIGKATNGCEVYVYNDSNSETAYCRLNANTLVVYDRFLLMDSQPLGDKTIMEIMNSIVSVPANDVITDTL